MASFHLTSRAKERLVEIWAYSADKWGPEQADTYQDKLEAAFQRIADLKAATHSCTRFYPEANPSLSYHLVERHYVIFRVSPAQSGRIDILTLIHEASSELLRSFLQSRDVEADQDAE